MLARQTRTRPDSALLTAPLPAVPDLPGRIRALAWLRAERANLLACVDEVTRVGQHARVIALTASLAGLFRQDGPWTDAITRHTAGCPTECAQIRTICTPCQRRHRGSAARHAPR